MEKLFNIKVDVKNNSGVYSGLVQYDNKTSIIYIKLVENLREITIGNYEEIYCLIKRPDKIKIKLPCEVSEDKKVLKVVLTDSVLSIPGICECEIKIINKDSVFTSGDFYLEIRETLVSGKCGSIVTNPFLPKPQGPPGPPGPPGKDGKDGHTPILGIDFFREDDKKKMLEDINIRLIEEGEILKLF